MKGLKNQLAVITGGLSDLGTIIWRSTTNPFQFAKTMRCSSKFRHAGSVAVNWKPSARIARAELRYPLDEGVAAFVNMPEPQGSHVKSVLINS